MVVGSWTQVKLEEAIHVMRRHEEGIDEVLRGVLINKCGNPGLGAMPLPGPDSRLNRVAGVRMSRKGPFNICRFER